MSLQVYQSDVYLKNIIDDELGGWPLISNKDSAFSSLELINRLSKYKSVPLFSVIVSPNPKNTRKNIIKVK